MHLIVLPEALVLSAVGPKVSTIAFNVVASELTFVAISIKPSEGSMSLFQPLYIISLVLGSVSPFLVAIAMLLVIEPFSSIGSAILMEVHALTLGLIIDPLSFVNVSSSLDESSLSIGSIFCPIPFVEGSVFPDLPSHPMSLSVFPLSVVDSSVVELNRRLLFKRIGVREFELSKLHVGIFDRFRTYL